MTPKPVALVTGASRSIGIGAAIAAELSRNGWDIAVTYWTDYDRSMPWGGQEEDVHDLATRVQKNGSRFYAMEADLSDPQAPALLFDSVEKHLSRVSAMILSHCYSVDSDIITTTVESFDRHFSINTRASWLLIREFALRFRYQDRPGRIIALTSDHTVFNLPYGASKGALDRIVIAAADELRDKKIVANVINPGATDTGWMDEELKQAVAQKTFQKRVATPQDAANLAAFLCSKSGEWINGQVLYSNGGIRW